MHQPAGSQLLDFVACVPFWISNLSKYMARLQVLKFFSVRCRIFVHPSSQFD